MHTAAKDANKCWERERELVLILKGSSSQTA